MNCKSVVRKVTKSKTILDVQQNRTKGDCPNKERFRMKSFNFYGVDLKLRL